MPQYIADVYVINWEPIRSEDVFYTREEAEKWCIEVAAKHHDRVWVVIEICGDGRIVRCVGRR